MNRVFKRNMEFKVKGYFLAVNHGVLGSSPRGGATLDKPSEMMAFSLSINELAWLHLFTFSLLTL
ncbi:MAG: hypothetical protein RIR51_2010 [Bacteroidota bacterium]